MAQRPTSRPASRRSLPRGFIAKRIQLSDGTRRKYAVFIPPQYETNTSHRWPVILFLHGSGEKGRNGINQTTIGLPVFVSRNAASFPFIVVAPQAQEMWFRGKEAEAAWETLEAVHQEYRTDRDRVCLTGLSMGGFGAWELAVLRPDIFAAIVPICGMAPKEYLSNIVNLPVWTFHGAQDESVPVSGSRDAVVELRRLGGDPVYTEYPNLRHTCWDEAYASKGLYRWLLQQRRKPPPKVIDYSFPGGLARVWWLAVESAEDAARPMHVRAEIGDDGAVTITSEGVAGLALVSNSEPLAPGTNIKVNWNGKTVFTGTFEGVFSTKPFDAKAHAPN